MRKLGEQWIEKAEDGKRYNMNVVHLIDCMEFMKGIPDKYYELAIVDPPYFEQYGKQNYTGSDISTTGIKRQTKAIKFWGIPDDKYFKELYRISKNQIIWGCNYYAKYIPDVGRIVWDKKNDASTFSKAEIASKSFSLGVDMFRYEWNGMLQENMKNKESRIHPTQKTSRSLQMVTQELRKTKRQDIR